MKSFSSFFLFQTYWRAIARLPLFLWCSFCLVTCKKEFLETTPLGQLDANQLATKRGVEGLLIGAYSLLDGIGGNKSDIGSAASNWIYGSICGSEAYIGSYQGDGSTSWEQFTSTSQSAELASKWGTVYDGIQRANDVLRIMTRANDIHPTDMARMAGEARFLRAHYHFEAKKIWNQIPFIDETITYGSGNYRVSNDQDAWPSIVSDLKYAVDHLNVESYQGAKGRANKYTAMSLLAKVLMFRHQYIEAKIYLDSVIQSGKYHLAGFHDNFNAETKNGPESIFSAQMSVNDGANGLNGNLGDLFNFPGTGTGPGGCCGFFQPSQFLVNHFKTNPVTGLPDLDHFNETDIKFDSALSSGDPFIPYTGTVDPRLDWTVGRRGIPYLDWGIHPGMDWIRDQNFGGPYSPKKNIYYKGQQDQYTDAGFWGPVTTAINVNLIRYADVLLWAAEAEIETGHLDKAREYINRLRHRAADPAGWVKNPDGSPAANYKISEYSMVWTDPEFARKAVRFERMLELALEGHRFFDLVRWGMADQEINAYLLKEKKLRSYLNGVIFKKGCNEYFPIPQTQLDLSAGADGLRKLKQNPCY